MRKRLKFEDKNDFLVTVSVPSLGLTYDVANYHIDGLQRTRAEMALEALAYFESQVVMHNHHVTDGHKDHNMIISAMKLELFQSDSWIHTVGPFHFSRYPIEHELPSVNRDVATFFRMWDLDFIPRISGVACRLSHFTAHIWKKSADGNVAGIKWGITPSEYFPTLTDLCLRSLSYYNRMFTGDSLGSYTVSSCDNIYPDKIDGLLEKFDTPTHEMKCDVRTSKSMFLGLKRMYRYMGTNQYFGRLVWRYTDLDVDLMHIPEGSSAGIRAGETVRVKVAKNVMKTITPNGTKGDQAEGARQRVKDYIARLRRGEMVDLEEIACCICLKQEIFNSYSIDPEVRRKLAVKCREFFIPNIVPYIISSLVQKDRQMIERGRMIKIGMRWWHGGAMRLAKQLRWNDSRARFFDSDIKHQDTSTKAQLLELYASQCLVYTDKTLSDWKLYRQLCMWNTSYMSVHMVHVMFSLWTIMVGKMYSGGFETSHGNSWNLGLLFWSWYETVISLHPERAVRLNEAFDNNEIEFVCYGDDHVQSVPDDLSDLINEDSFNKWCNEIWGFEFHKVRRNIPFLSVPDHTGNLKSDGVVFLKRRFIRRPPDFPNWMPEVLPYKTMDDMLVKFAWGNTPRDTLIDYAISCIGLAYDGMGTNAIVHEFAMRFYNFCIMKTGIRTADDLVRAFSTYTDDKKRDITRISRKMNIPVEVILTGFPSRGSLFALHKNDDDYTNFTPPFKSYSPSEIIQWDQRASALIGQ